MRITLSDCAHSLRLRKVCKRADSNSTTLLPRRSLSPRVILITNVEFPASELTSLQIPPERTFRARCVTSQSAADDLQPFFIVNFIDPSRHRYFPYEDCIEVEFQFPLLDRRGLRGGRLKTSKTVRIAAISHKVGDQPPRPSDTPPVQEGKFHGRSSGKSPRVSLNVLFVS